MFGSRAVDRTSIGKGNIAVYVYACSAFPNEIQINDSIYINTEKGVIFLIY